MTVQSPLSRTKQQLLHENAELRQRLAEAEDTLRAIREGEVDAVIVSGSKGEQVFSLRESESIYRLMVETMNEAGLAVTPEGVILFANNCLSRMLQRPLEQIVGQPLSAFVHERDRSRLNALLTAARESSADSRITLVASDGRAIPVFVWAHLLARPDGPTICLVGVDLTQLETSKEIIKHLEEQRAALQESEERLRSLAENVPCVLMRFDRQLRIVYLSKQSDRYNPNPVERMIGRTNREMGMPEHLCARWDAATERVFSTGNQEEMEFDFPGPSGMRTFALKFAPEFGPDHEVRYVLGVSWDITERKRAEEALRQNEERLRLATEVSGTGLWFLDVPRRQLSLSDRCRTLYGLPGDGAVTIDRVLETVHPDDRASVRQSVADTLADTEDHEIEYRVVWSDGSIHWLQIRTRTLAEADGAPQVNIGVAREVTVRKEHEQRLVAFNEELEKRVSERTIEVQRQSIQLRALASELSQAEQRERKRLSVILHDHIQQLLVAARMQLGLVERAKPQVIQSTVKGIDSILAEAITASRSLAVELSPPVLHTAGLIGALNWLASRTLDRNHFGVHLRADNKAEPAVEETRFLLFECARELLLNAVKHSGVSDAHVTLIRSREGSIKLAVRDEGKGFDPDLLDKRRAGDASFGLFSIQQRLAHIGGGMEIATAPGKGTAITLTVPVAQEPPRAQELDDTAAVGQRAGKLNVRGKQAAHRILIADDHKIVREGLAGLMQFEPDIEVVGQAADGQEAVDLAEKLKPDVIIMDVNLGEMTGVEATKKILAKDPAAKVIALSMHKDKNVADAMREAGAVAYLTKGGPSEDLIAAIRASRAK